MPLGLDPSGATHPRDILNGALATVRSTSTTTPAGAAGLLGCAIVIGITCLGWNCVVALICRRLFSAGLLALHSIAITTPTAAAPPATTAGAVTLLPLSLALIGVAGAAIAGRPAAIRGADRWVLIVITVGSLTGRPSVRRGAQQRRVRGEEGHLRHSAHRWRARGRSRRRLLILTARPG